MHRVVYLSEAVKLNIDGLLPLVLEKQNGVTLFNWGGGREEAAWLEDNAIHGEVFLHHLCPGCVRGSLNSLEIFQTTLGPDTMFIST